MSRAKATVQPECTAEECRRLKRLKSGAAVEIARMHKTKALMHAVQFAADHDADFVVADALAAILQRLEQHMDTLGERVTQAMS